MPHRPEIIATQRGPIYEHMMRAAFDGDTYGLTHLGKVRQVNEDRMLIKSRPNIWAVADGMGGHDAGDYASSLSLHYLDMVRDLVDPQAFSREVFERIHDANAELRAEAQRRGGGVIGTTVVCMIALGQEAQLLWVGDSRAYLMRNQTLRRLSRDHSMVQDMVDAGVISPEEAEEHPQANILTRAVGATDKVEIASLMLRIEPGDVYLLCSDGLSRYVSDNAIAAILRTPMSAQQHCETLINAALDTPAEDNITAVVVAAPK